MRIVFTIVICCFTALAEAVNHQSLSFPKLSALEASMSFTLLDGKKGKKIYLGPNVGMELPKAYTGASRFNYRLYKQRSRSPLVFLLPGLGAKNGDGPGNNLAQLLHGQGYHVVVLTSPFTSEFVALSSESLFVGQASLDARDIYREMIEIRANLSSRGVRVSRWGILGISYGALIGAHVGNLDSQQRLFDFKKVLLVNPPVNLKYALGRLDYYYRHYEKLKGIQRADLFFKFNHYRNIVKKTGMGYFKFHGQMKKINFSEFEMRSLIGKVFRDILDEVVDISLLMAGPPLLSMNFQEKQMNYNDYVTRVIPSYYQKTQQGKSLWRGHYGNGRVDVNRMNQVNSLRGAKKFLSQSARIRVFHTEDDFLISSDDLRFLKRTLKNKLTLFPVGGHLGYLWHEKARSLLVSEFHQSLK